MLTTDEYERRQGVGLRLCILHADIVDLFEKATNNRIILISIATLTLPLRAVHFYIEKYE